MSTHDLKSEREPCRYCTMDHGEEGEIPSEPGLAALHSFTRMMRDYGIPVKFTGTDISPKQIDLLNKLCDLIYWELCPDLANEWRSRVTVVAPLDLLVRSAPD